MMSSQLTLSICPLHNMVTNTSHNFNFTLSDLSHHWLDSTIQILGWIFIQTLGNWLTIMMIKIKNDLPKRTLFDHVFNILCQANLMNNLITVNISILRHFSGPHGYFICTIQLLASNICEVYCLLCLMEHCGIRLLYVTIWKNIGMMNDDFVCSFLNIFNVFFALLFETIKYAVNDHLFMPLVRD